jgi:ABC-type antimicrobial peptide transport system permease subunit
MKKTTGYLRSALYNIGRNKVYALFCIAGTALTSVFIVLILQLIFIQTSNYPPLTYADRIIRLDSFRDTESRQIGGISVPEINAFLENLNNDYDCISLLHTEGINIMANERLHFSTVGFVNADFWKMYTFEFLYGKPFSNEDCINRKKSVIITENVSLTYFNTKNSIGKKIFFQSNEYEIAGVVKNFSAFSTPSDDCETWAPSVFNKFIPSGWVHYVIDLLTPPAMSMDISKEKTVKAVRHYFEQKNITVDFSPQKVQTLKDEKLKQSDSNFYQYGPVVALILLLLIPAVNILSFSITNTNNRAEEIALRKTFGASHISSFMQIMTENAILVITGTITGLVVAVPVLKFIQQYANIPVTLIAHIDYWIIFAGVLPAMLVFSLLSGGLPAYLISKRNIAQVLKGGSK